MVDLIKMSTPPSDATSPCPGILNLVIPAGVCGSYRYSRISFIYVGHDVSVVSLLVCILHFVFASEAYYYYINIMEVDATAGRTGGEGFIRNNDRHGERNYHPRSI